MFPVKNALMTMSLASLISPIDEAEASNEKEHSNVEVLLSLICFHFMQDVFFHFIQVSQFAFHLFMFLLDL